MVLLLVFWYRRAWQTIYPSWSAARHHAPNIIVKEARSQTRLYHTFSYFDDYMCLTSFRTKCYHHLMNLFLWVTAVDCQSLSVLLMLLFFLLSRIDPIFDIVWHKRCDQCHRQFFPRQCVGKYLEHHWVHNNSHSNLLFVPCSSTCIGKSTYYLPYVQRRYWSDSLKTPLDGTHFFRIKNRSFQLFLQLESLSFSLASKGLGGLSFLLPIINLKVCLIVRHFWQNTSVGTRRS